MKRKLKICSPQLGLDPNSDLGGEVHDHFVLQELANKRYKIFVYLPKDKDYQHQKNIFVTRAPFKHIPAIIFNLLIIPYLFKTYRKEKFDILRVHSPYFVGLGALFFKFFHRKIPIVTTYHLIEKGFVFYLINKFTANKYDAIFCVSQYIKNWLIKEYKLSPEKIFVIYNGVDLSLRPMPKDKVLTRKYNLQNKFVIMFMGLLIERKNPMFLLKIYKKLKGSCPNIALLICGKGPMEKALKNFIKMNKLQDVIFAGVVSGKDKIKHLNLCDVFALPSKNEGFGLVIAEAMTCAKPVVIMQAWSAQEAVTDGVEGFLCKSDDINDWMSKLNKLIDNPELVRRLGKAACRKAKENFTWKIVINHEMKILNKLIK